LYTDAANSPRRRSTQTALHRMVTRLCMMLSPVLAYTADEAWDYVPGKTASSVHLLRWEPAALSRSDEERQAWLALFDLREKVLPELEKARQEKLIGKALEAKVTLTGTFMAGVAERREELRELLNVSQLALVPGGETLAVQVSKADGQKCERCWHWEVDVGAAAEHSTLCGRCAQAVTRA